MNIFQRIFKRQKQLEDDDRARRLAWLREKQNILSERKAIAVGSKRQDVIVRLNTVRAEIKRLEVD